MGLSKKAIEEFKEIYKKEFKEDISDDKARELGENLISLFRIIYRPIPKDDIKVSEDARSGGYLTQFINGAKIEYSQHLNLQIYAAIYHLLPKVL